MTSENTKEVLDLLRRLQESLTEVGQLEKDIAATPEKIAALEKEIDDDERAVTEAEQELQEEKLRYSRLEVELNAAQENLSQKNQQTLLVKTNEQLWALQKEIEYIKEKISNTELRIIESFENQDILSEELKKAKSVFEKAKSENFKEITDLNRNLESMQSRLAESGKIQQDIRSEIPQQYLDLIDRIQGSKGDTALAEAKDGACQVCHFRIRPQIYVEVKTSKVIHQCSNCSRILFYRDE